MVLRAVSELRRERMRRHGGGPLQEAGGRAPCRQADAPGLRRGAPAVRPPAEDLRGHHEPRRLRALRPEGLHPVPNLRGGGRLQEAERGEVRSVYGVDFRVVSDAEAEHSRLELLPAAVLEVSCWLDLVVVDGGANFSFFSCCRKITRGGTVMISPDYELSKKRLYRSSDE